MIVLEDLLKLHEALIQQMGGTAGLRDPSLLEAALHRPFSGFGDTEFYPTPIEKASALGESLIQNHPFLDGNKRIGYFAMRAFLLHHKMDIKKSVSEDEKYDFVIQIASSKMSFDEILNWLKERVEFI